MGDPQGCTPVRAYWKHIGSGRPLKGNRGGKGFRMSISSARQPLLRAGLVGLVASSVGAAMVAVVLAGPPGPDAIAAGAVVRPALATPLHVAGNGIYASDRTGVVLGGIHRSGYLTAFGDDLGGVEANALASWASMVRIETNASLVAGGCTSSGPSPTPSPSANPADYLLRLDRAVAKLAGRNVVALIDLHISSPKPCGTSRSLPMPERSEALGFWRTIANRYASNPMVAFELWNEPHAVTADQWLHGGMIDGGSGVGTYRAAGMQELYDTVRAASSTNLIFVDTPDFSIDTRVINSGILSIDASRTVWALHVYNCSLPSDTACVNNQAMRTFPASSAAVKAWDSVASTKAVVVTETGFPDRTSGTWFSTASAWAGGHSPAIGVIGFADDGNWSGSPWSLTSGQPDWNANAAGQPLVDYMRRVAPLPTPSPTSSSPSPSSPGMSPSPSVSPPTASPPPSPSPTNSPSPSPTPKPKAPSLAQTSQNGGVTLTVTVDRRFAGRSAIFFVRSGISGHVRPLGTAPVESSGMAVRGLQLKPGQILALYSKLLETYPEEIQDRYSNTVTFKVK